MPKGRAARHVALTISKDLTLAGAGADLVTIEPTPSARTGIAGDDPNLRDGKGDIIAVLGQKSDPSRSTSRA